MTRSLARTVVPRAVVTLAAAVLLAGCGSTAPTSSPSAAAPTASGPASTSAAGSTAGATAAATSAGTVPALTGNPTDLTRESQATAGSGQPPSALVTHDVVVGKGPTAAASNTVAVRYSGTLWTDGSLFDASWSRGTEPISFPLAQVVPGFSQGIAGMQAGGRRVLVIPPALGYGDQAQGPIPGGSTLVFVVDLVSIS